MKQETCCNVAFYILFFTFAGQTHGFKLNIFKDFDYKGLIYETESTATECTDLPKHAKGTVGSLRTTACMLAFENDNCEGFSSKLAPGMPELPKLMKVIKSYKPCSSTLGGEKIHVQLLNGNKPLGDYIDVCGCQNLPPHVSSNINRLDNFMNCVEIFSAQGCTGRSQEIPGGKNVYSENLRALGYYPRSFKACGNRPSCLKLSSVVYKLDLFADEDESEKANEKEVELASKTIFYNNGTATVTQEFTASKTITEAFELTRTKTVTEMEKTRTEEKLEVEVDVKVNAIFVKVDVNVKNTFTEAHTIENSEETKVTEKFTKEEAKTFEFKQAIEIPPCSEYEVSATVSVVENYPIVYDLYMRVTGEASGLRLRVEEIIPQISDMEYVETYDEFTAIFKTRGIMMANIGLDTWITGVGKEIPNCLTNKMAK